MDKKHIKYTIVVQIILYLVIVLETSKVLPTDWQEINKLHYITYTIFNIVWNILMTTKI